MAASIMWRRGWGKGTSKQADEYAVGESQISSYFRAVIDATEEAVLNSILRCSTVTGRDDNTRPGIPIGPLKDILARASRT